jgi:hypothetical protein
LNLEVTRSSVKQRPSYPAKLSKISSTSNRTVVEAKRLGIGRDEMLASIAADWRRLGSDDDAELPARPTDGGRPPR